jgi:hypothetical protein
MPAAQVGGQVDHLQNPIDAGFSYGLVSIHQGDIGGPVQAKPYIITMIIFPDFPTPRFRQVFGKKPGEIKAQLRQFKTVLQSKIGRGHNIPRYRGGGESNPARKVFFDS